MKVYFALILLLFISCNKFDFQDNYNNGRSPIVEDKLLHLFIETDSLWFGKPATDTAGNFISYMQMINANGTSNEYYVDSSSHYRIRYVGELNLINPMLFRYNTNGQATFKVPEWAKNKRIFDIYKNDTLARVVSFEDIYTINSTIYISYACCGNDSVQLHDVVGAYNKYIGRIYEVPYNLTK